MEHPIEPYFKPYKKPTDLAKSFADAFNNAVAALESMKHPEGQCYDLLKILWFLLSLVQN